ncbi:F-box-like protein [Medicago truncatula]|uniref:F-box-like protein n=1 Tax=Medicago truncatula TaxID=3880 RepID=G7LJJ6_MEDTR|nr:F-box-like protein [Medicago truncatula]
MGDDFKIVKRKLTLYHSQNDTVSTLPVPETNAENILLLPELPKELIDEILARLPVRSLLQFKCVCKSWNGKPEYPILSSQRAIFESPPRIHY